MSTKQVVQLGRARVGRGAVLGAGVILSKSMPLIDADSCEIGRGHVPAWSVAVMGTRIKDLAGGSFKLPYALVIKRLAEREPHDNPFTTMDRLPEQTRERVLGVRADLGQAPT